MEFDLEGMGLREPEDWTPAARTDGEASLGADFAEQDSLLDDCLSGHSLGASLLGPCDSMGAVDHFPCIADELEEQAKQLEGDWLNPSQLAALADGKAVHLAGSGRASRLALHAELKRMEQQQQQQRQQQQQQQEKEQRSRPAEGAGPQRQASGVREEPVTPQRHSTANDSSWNESPLPGGGAGLDAGEVQSPDPVKLLSLPSGPSGAQRPPLAAAISNAQSVRLGREPAPGAWRGCGRSAWCSLEPRHGGACTDCAAVPGLLAYPPLELFHSGVNIEELCRVPEELEEEAEAEGVPAPDTESEGEGGRPAAAAGCLSSGKRCAEAEADDGASHSQSGGAASSSSPGAAVEQPRPAGPAAKRRRGGEVGSPAGGLAAALPDLAAAAAAALEPPPAMPVPELADGLGPPSLAAAAAAAMELSLHPLLCMVPVALPPPPPGALDMPQFAPPVPPMPAPSLGAYLRNLGRPAGAPRLRPLPTAPPPTPAEAKPVAAAAAAATPSKPVTRQKHTHTPSGAAAPAAPRSSGRRTVLQWHTDSVTDPRTGAAITAVQPGTFCTQCYALSTPVWRAGPFGPKSLCNACGVRWMKYAKGSKK
ncbi:expressed protein [Chlorella variabilis]|uniref:Expressed protein n=1 Tax=Chlorella variabilis TaxID=554065 RepID=E1ZIL7_CHLVA|nr:expressed protein [Chlorella variabilis]EFN54181.1 expressed protein [Chlorella variabilis]|eukprot:XP_005846283.1 expressed protein [Chlorella variabilis]